jgi:multidrug resistance efflux pump
LADPGKAVPGNAVTPGKRLRFGLAIKAGLAGSLLGLAAWMLVSHNRLTAHNAVVSAYVVSVRSPIQGQVSGLRLHIGDQVNGTSSLARVSNDRVSDERLTDLRGEVARDRAEQQALEAERQALYGLRTALAARSEAFRASQIAYTEAASAEATAQLARSSLLLELVRRDTARKVILGRSGVVSTAGVDQATSDARVAEAEVTSQTAHLTSLRAKEAAAALGIFLDTGANDVSYSAQRIDEIDLRLADADRAAAALVAGEAAAENRLAAEERRFALQSEANLEPGANGMIWKLGASNGERVGTGDTLAEVIDCGASFIVASIPQRQFSSVAVGSTAQFRLLGETTDREGRVLSVTGDSSVSIDRNLAATPVADPVATAVVRVEVAPSGNNGAECLVGRTARVLLPSNGGDMTAWLLRWLP